MSLKNLNVIKTPKNLVSKLSNSKIKNLFRIFEKNFKIKESFAVAVSGGPDSLSLAFLTTANSLSSSFFSFIWFSSLALIELFNVSMLA